MLILATSKIQSNYQTTIPKEIRKNYDIDNKTDGKTNAVELKRGLYEWEKYS